MAKDFVFNFYAGDCLRDTQLLSAAQKGVYLDIICYHMKNIRVSQDILNRFTRDLSEPEKREFLTVLDSDNDGFYIEWVVTSVLKRRAYSESRRNNRKGKTKKDMKNTSLSYDKHMENEIEIENSNKEKGIQREKPKLEPQPQIELPFHSAEFENQWQRWKIYKKDEHRFTYKTQDSEQTALENLARDALGNEQTAIEIINHSIGNGYKGLFPLKNNSNASNNRHSNNGNASGHGEKIGRIAKQELHDFINAGG